MTGLHLETKELHHHLSRRQNALFWPCSNIQEAWYGSGFRASLPHGFAVLGIVWENMFLSEHATTKRYQRTCPPQTQICGCLTLQQSTRLKSWIIHINPTSWQPLQKLPKLPLPPHPAKKDMRATPGWRTWVTQANWAHLRVGGAPCGHGNNCLICWHSEANPDRGRGRPPVTQKDTASYYIILYLLYIYIHTSWYLYRTNEHDVTWTEAFSHWMDAFLSQVPNSRWSPPESHLKVQHPSCKAGKGAKAMT